MNPSDREALLDILAQSEVNLTAKAFVEEIAKAFDTTRRRAKARLRELVDTRAVAYQDLYGSTYVMESFLKPVRMTDRFFILPPGMETQAGPQRLNIQIFQGISFGSGHHPTTRLCLEALDRLFFDTPGLERLPGRTAGDVGTGSGVLAIAACLAGMESCLAWEIDPNAVSEAKKNVAANDLEDRIRVIDDLMPAVAEPLALILANLRYPTLKQIAPLLKRNLLPKGYLILSGLRDWEKEDLLACFQTHGFSLAWDRTLKHWTGLILKSL